MQIKWLGHASFKLKGTKTVYIDPWKISPDEKADIILITHPHFDHFSPEDIGKIQKPETIIVGPKDSIKGIEGNIKELEPGQSLELSDIKIQTFVSYNKNKEFHPRKNNWLSFLIRMDGTSVFHTGDADDIKDFHSIKTDVLLIPVSGTYVMNYKEASSLANIMKPKLCIPMHWGDIVGSEDDAKKFKKVSKSQVEILKPGETLNFP